MPNEESNQFGSLFPSTTDNTSAPSETKSTPIWRDIEESYKDIFAFDECLRDEAIFRYNILDTLVDIHGLSLSIKHIEASNHLLNDKFGPNVPSVISIYRYWRAFSRSGFELSSLIPNVSSGNTKKRVSEELELYIEEAIRNYFSDEEQTMQSAYIELETEILRYNDTHDLELKLFSIQSFRKRIKKLPEYEQYVLKKGKTKADAFYRKVGERPKTTRVLERVEVDHTRLDLFVIDEHHGVPLGRPWLTLLYDVHSKSVTGFYIGFEPPSYLSVALALEKSILPKSYVSDLYPKVCGVWPCYGLPENLIVDNGTEFNSKDFKVACKELHIKVKKNPTKKPWLKGSVERYFRTINNKLLSGIPGKSFSNIFERKDYDPLKNAVIDSATLLEMVHIWLIDVYQSGKNGLETNIPNMTWMDALKSSVPPRVYKGTHEQLKFNLGKNEVVALDKNGVRLGTTIRYSSKRLARYWGSHTTDSKSVRVRIKYNPSCLGKIYVLDEDKNEFFSVEAISADYAYSVSMWLHKVCCKYVRDNVRRNYNHDDVIRAWKTILDIIETAIGKSAQTKSKNTLGIRTTTKAQRVTEHSERAKLEAKKPINTISSLTENEDIDWDVETDPSGWSFDSVKDEEV